MVRAGSRSSHSPYLLRAGALVFTLLLSATSLAQAGEQQGDHVFSTGSSSWDGYVEFARLAQKQLGIDRVVIKSHINYDELTKDDAVIIVHPMERLDESSLGAFLVDGGRLAILDDYGRGAEFLQNFGIKSIASPSDPAESLRSNPSLAIAIPSLQSNDDAQKGHHPMTAGIERVVTNHPRVFEHPDLTVVLGIVDKEGQTHALALTGVIAQKGRLFALGDPSVFINLMLRYPGNRKLAEGLVQYLTSDPNHSATAASTQGRLYLLSNQFKQRGAYGKPASLKNKVDAAINESAEALRNIMDDGLTREASLALCFLIMACILAHIRQTLRFSQFPLPSYSRAPHPAAQIGAASRLDVLQSSHAEPALLVLELDAVLRDAVSRRLHEDGGAAPAQIAKSAQAKGLTPTEALELSQVLTEFQRYGRELGRRKPTKVREHDLRRFHEQTMRLLRIIEENKVSA